MRGWNQQRANYKQEATVAIEGKRVSGINKISPLTTFRLTACNTEKKIVKDDKHDF